MINVALHKYDQYDRLIFVEWFECEHAQFDENDDCTHNHECSSEALSLNDGYNYSPKFCRKSLASDSKRMQP